MSTDAISSESAKLTPLEQLRYARQVLQLESRALGEVAKRLDQRFCRAVEHILRCSGGVIVTGIGKAGLVGQKIMATLASTGTRSHYLHPAEAVHGDLGRIHRDDVVLMLSQSGETEEVVRLLPSLAQMRVVLVAITGSAESTLGRAATVTIELGPMEEACRLGLAPSTSTTAMLAVGDALALVVSRMRDFSREDFARFHPGGSLGQKLSRVEHHLRPLDQCRVASDEKTVREVFVSVSKPGRRTGAIMLVDAAGRLSGVFTDSDLAKLFERRRDREFDGPVREVMTARPITVPLGLQMADAVAIMAQRKISELPVVDGEGRPVGLVDITDVVGLLPPEPNPADDPTVPVRPTVPAAGPSQPRCRLFREPGPPEPT